MAAQLKRDGVDVQGMLADNDIVGSSTADDGTIEGKQVDDVAGPLLLEDPE